MVMEQQPRDAEILASSLAPWGHRMDDKIVFTDFLEDAKRRREQVTRDRKPIASVSSGVITGTTVLAPVMMVLAPPAARAHPTAALTPWTMVWPLRHLLYWHELNFIVLIMRTMRETHPGTWVPSTQCTSIK
jgi:hypothetical protein